MTSNIVKILILFCLTFISCEEVIDYDLNESEPQLVIEGNITDSTVSYIVKISKTVNVYNNGNFNGVSGAFITLSNNKGLIDTLTEFTNGVYQSRNLAGIQSDQYNLFSIIEGKEYSSVSIMPVKVNLDSIYSITNNGGFGSDIFIVPRFLDPGGVRNFYMFILFINGKQTKDMFVLNDERKDGLVFNQSLRTIDTIKKGDNIIVEMRCIDENVYKYFHALSLNIKRGNNQNQTPTNPPSNIQGNRLGYFSAHTVQRKSMIVP